MHKNVQKNGSPYSMSNMVDPARCGPNRWKFNEKCSIFFLGNTERCWPITRKVIGDRVSFSGSWSTHVNHQVPEGKFRVLKSIYFRTSATPPGQRRTPVCPPGQRRCCGVCGVSAQMLVEKLHAAVTTFCKDYSLEDSTPRDKWENHPFMGYLPTLRLPQR
jgi:hypothetical protein